MPKIFIYGDSHTRALKDAVISSSSADTDIKIDIHWRWSEKNGNVRGDMKFEDAKNIVTALRDRDILVLSFIGTAHNIFGLLEHERRYYVQDDQSLSSIPGNHELIPANAMRDLFYSIFSKNHIIKELKQLSCVPVYHLMTPPPKQDNNYIKFRTSLYRGRSTREYDINLPGVRLALWRLEMGALVRFCCEMGVDVLPPPPEAISDDGFMRPEYYENDATHANKHYGELVLNQLKDRISQ